jgi:hypothetical protein
MRYFGSGFLTIMLLVNEVEHDLCVDRNKLFNDGGRLHTSKKPAKKKK